MGSPSSRGSVASSNDGVVSTLALTPAITVAAAIVEIPAHDPREAMLVRGSVLAIRQAMWAPVDLHRHVQVRLRRG